MKLLCFTQNVSVEKKMFLFVGKNTTERHKKIILQLSGKKLQLCQGDSLLCFFVFTVSQPQRRREPIWISTSGSTHSRPREIVSLSAELNSSGARLFVVQETRHSMRWTTYDYGSHSALF